MRPHQLSVVALFINTFQYRKRYEVTCDRKFPTSYSWCMITFQYRKRYEVTCDYTVNGLATEIAELFQYRKRYEVTCDQEVAGEVVADSSVSIPQAVRGHMRLLYLIIERPPTITFQYRKRYEVTCDNGSCRRTRKP